MRFLSLRVVRRARGLLTAKARAASDSAPRPDDAARVDPQLNMDLPLLEFASSWPATLEPSLRSSMVHCMRVLPGFVSGEEEAALLLEVEPKLKRMRYEYDHWDDAIHGYKETEHGDWQPHNAAVMARVRAAAFNTSSCDGTSGPSGGEEPSSGTSSEEEVLTRCHVLDLAPAGHIKPHIDATRYCGRVIAGLCLLSAGVMRLQHAENPDLVLDALLPRRGLYVMTDAARYDFKHSVLSNEVAAWRGQRVVRRRRVAIISRSRPPPPTEGNPVFYTSDTIERTQ